MRKRITSGLRIIQLVDTLSLGGAEVMAVNLSNLLSDHNILVLLIATRKGGKAGNRLKPDIPRFIANKKSSYDVFAFFRLLKVVMQFKPSHIHAHSTSIVWASMLKLFMPRVKLIWHDHNGMREALVKNRNISIAEASAFLKVDQSIRFFRFLFHGVIVLNDISLQFAVQSLKIPKNKIVLLKNFAYPKAENSYEFEFKEYNNILMVANMREQKAHDFLLGNIDVVLDANVNWQILLVGKEFDDDWTKYVKRIHANLKNRKRVLLLGEREDTFDLMLNADIGLLTSKSEGLPVTLIEYGMAELPTVCSDVGYCKQVMGSTEVLFEYGDSEQFKEKLTRMINDVVWRKKVKKRFGEYVYQNYGSNDVFLSLIEIYRENSQ